MKPASHAAITIVLAALASSAQAQVQDDHIVPDEPVIREMLKPPSGLDEAQLRDALRHCDGTTMQMKICAAYLLTVQDLRLNRVYAQARKSNDDARRAALLVKAQRAWVAWRDAQCEFEAYDDAGGGTMEGLDVLTCKEDLTRQQADRLDAPTKH
jgi:uncharacterized protein YecT (DUF1311 family)